jgi:type II restriction enzyme
LSYFAQIKELIAQIPTTLVDFSQPRETVRIPTQVSTNFITNREQGDWAERLIMQAINQSSKDFVAVKYGKSDDIVAGELGWGKFYQSYQEELDKIGKRPDLLIFRKSVFNNDWGIDISSIPQENSYEYVRKAVAGIEVRSSAFLIDRYEEAMQKRTQEFSAKAIKLRDELLSDYKDVMQHPKRMDYINILQSINHLNLDTIGFRCPTWSSSQRLSEAKELFKELKHAILEVQKRDYLSITPKVEDLKIVHKWIETFNVPHYYFQVFFDKIYGISFKQILSIIADSEKEDIMFSIETDVKNQNKTTIKIDSKAGKLLASKIDEPSHKSARRELERGRLLFYVTFDGGGACMDLDAFASLLEI